MTYSNTFTPPSTSTNVVAFTGMPKRTRNTAKRLLPGNGDGSTLSLDFTTGVLDPRLTFTRSTNATFINSQGYVQYANANIMKQSENCGSWSGGQNIAPTADAAVAPNGTQTADQLNLLATSFRYQVTASVYAVGQPYVASIWMRTVSGTASVGFRIANTNTGSNSAIATCSVTETWQRFNTPAFTLTDTANRTIDVGVDQRSIVSGPNVAANIYVWGLQVQPGTSAGEYLPTTTTEEFDTPRFDYDPTTLAPRGLLIEGSAATLVARSQALNQSSWLKTSATSISETGTGSPANDATSNVLTWTNGTAVGNAYTEQSGLPVSASQPYTWSVWLKNRGNRRVSVFGFTKTSANAFAGNLEMTIDFSVATPTATITTSTNFTSTSAVTPVAFGNGWYRCVMIGTTPSNAAVTGFGISNKDAVPASGTNGCEVWGAQLEAGTGASSYIPTGASTGSRAEDTCYMDGTNFSSWYSASTQTGTLFADITHSALANANGGIELGNGLGSQTSSNRVSLRRDVAIVDGVSSITVSPTGASQRFKTAIAFAPGTGNTAACRNGGTVSNPAQAAGTLSGINALKFYIDASPALRPYGWIRQVKVWPTNIANTTLQAITTL